MKRFLRAVRVRSHRGSPAPSRPALQRGPTTSASTARQERKPRDLQVPAVTGKGAQYAHAVPHRGTAPARVRAEPPDSRLYVAEELKQQGWQGRHRYTVMNVYTPTRARSTLRDGRAGTLHRPDCREAAYDGRPDTKNRA